MSDTQQLVASQFIQEMGSMVEDKEKVQRVLMFIRVLHNSAPCQYDPEEVREMGLQSLAAAKAGKGTTHDDVKRLAESWRR